jgi:hypothetical protein
MVYVHEPALKELHDNVAAFILGTRLIPLSQVDQYVV